MTKPKTNFADEDMAVASRALWVLEGHGPGLEQPPPDVDLNRLTSFVGSDGFLAPLAHFAMVRHTDAIRAAAWVPPDQEDSPNVLVALAKRRLEAQLEACRHEKRANAQLREALLRVGNAADDWSAAAAKRADDWARVPREMLTGEHEEVLDALRSAEEATLNAMTLMDRSMRQLPSDDVIARFRSTLGMPKADRNAVLAEQILHLEDAGISPEAIAYVMAWDYGDPESAKERTRQRLKDMRERRGLARATDGASGAGPET